VAVVKPDPNGTVYRSTMRTRALSIPGAWVFEPDRFDDDRGLFVAPYQEAAFIKIAGAPLKVAQANHSVSRRGVIRGVHFADVPPGQAKYIYCPHGELLDVVVDVRVGSPTYGRWDAIRLDSRSYRAMYLAEGLGHAFCALVDGTVASYLCSTPYMPAIEHTIDALDPALGLPWPTDLTPVLSKRDATALTLAEAEVAGLLPHYLG